MVLINGYRYAPIEACARHTQIFQTLPDETHHFVTTRIRLDEIRIGLDVSQQPRPIRRHPEEVALLGNPFHGPVTVRTVAVLQAVLEPKGFARGTVPALIFGAVDITLFVKLTKDGLHHPLMAGLRRANEIIVGDPQPPPKLLEGGHDRVHILLRLLTLTSRGALYFLSMFI